MIRANVTGVLISEEFSETFAGTIDPALDRANLRCAHLSRFLVSQTLGSDQQERLALVGRKPHQSRTQFRELYMPGLFWGDGDLGREQAIDILDLAPWFCQVSRQTRAGVLPIVAVGSEVP